MFDLRCSTCDVRRAMFDVRCSTYDVRRTMFDVRLVWYLKKLETLQGGRSNEVVQSGGAIRLIVQQRVRSGLITVSFCSVWNCMSDLIVDLWESNGINT